MSVPPFIKLNATFDADLLQQDLKKAELSHQRIEVIGP